MSVIKRFELHEITIPSGSTSASSLLSPKFRLDNTVVFLASSIENIGSPEDDLDNYWAEIILTDSPNTITADRGVGTAGDLECKVWVVEFDSDLVRVQTGTIDLTTTTTVSNTGSISDIDQNKTFLVYTYAMTTSAADDWGDALCRASFTSDTQITIARDPSTNQGTIEGTYYVAEYIGGNSLYGWDVQSATYTVIDDDSEGTSTISSVDTDKTFLYGSHRAHYQDDNPNFQTFWTQLTNSTTLTSQRQSGFAGNGDADFEVYVIEFNEGERDFNVQRGSVVLSGSTQETSVTISEIDQNRTMAFTVLTRPGNQRGGGSGAGSPHATSWVLFNSDTEINIHRGEAGNTGTSEIEWEVIQWPRFRRVQVIN